ncbi:VOC family protein [Glycomyces xiaoerkulensis]|uniref:VOC family protein n=1 Tax=Glycomyces xiaoerkulensis TaxID=2038139 RepID=UPI000C26B09E|nr:VOC family protein [Glycomyces xiaoerkulensis]
MSGNVTYFEVPGNDIAATERFWSELFGWTFYEGNFPGYSMIQGPEPMGGAPHDESSPRPRIYFAVEDLDAAVARVRKLGGTTEDPVAIPSGVFAHCTDDQGVEFSLFQEGGGES